MGLASNLQEGKADRLLFAEKQTAAVLQAREAVAKMDRVRVLGMEIDILMRDVNPLGDATFAEKLALSASMRREISEGSVRAANELEAQIEEIRALDTGDSVELEAVRGRMGEQVLMADHMEQMAVYARDATKAMKESYEEDVRRAREDRPPD